MTLEDLVAQLAAAYGAKLRAVVLYGSSADGSAAPRTPAAGGPAVGGAGSARGGAHDLLVIVDALGIAELRAVAATARAWGEAGHPPPLTLTTDEWRRSADVFPMEYADVLGRHRVLHGALPLDGIRVDPADLRRQVEHQVLGKLLQLRTAILGTGNDGRRQVALLEASFSTMLVLFRSLARLHGAAPASDREALVQWAGTTAGFDPAPFLRVARHVRGGPALPPAEAERVLAGYLDGLDRLAHHVDRFVPPGTPA